MSFLLQTTDLSQFIRFAEEVGIQGEWGQERP